MPRVEGTERLGLPREVVWALLNDPDTLGSSIPGCRGFERDADAEHRYRTAIKVAVGAVTGVYEGTVEYVDVVEPEHCTIVVAGKGDKGSIDGRGAITLTAREEGTEVGYEGEFKITGPVAGVGQRMAPGVSRKMIVETLRNLERQGEAAGAGASPTRSPTPPPEPGAGGPAPAVPDAKPADDQAPAAVPTPAAAPAASAAAEGARATSAADRPAPTEAFRPFAVSPAAAFAAGCVVGAVVGAALVALR